MIYKDILKVEFERRLKTLESSIFYTLSTGRLSSSFYPSLWSVLSYLWISKFKVTKSIRLNSDLPF